MINRVDQQHEFEREVEPTLRGTTYQARLWAAASTLASEESATFAQAPRQMGESFYSWEAPSAEDIPKLIDDTARLISHLEKTAMSNSREGAEIAGISYILTALIQPFPDFNKQTARLVSESYLRQYSGEAQKYEFVTPSNDDTNTEKFREIMPPIDFLAKLPTDQSIKKILSVGKITTQNSEELFLSNEQISLLEELLHDDALEEQSGLSFLEVDSILTKLGGGTSENDPYGRSLALGKKIHDSALYQLLTLQIRRFLSEVTINGIDQSSPETRLLQMFVDKYLDALPKSLVPTDASLTV